MASRRQIITGVAASVTIAGCSTTPDSSTGSEDTTSDDQSESSGEDTTQDTEEDAAQSFRNVSIEIRNISYGFDGLSAGLRLRNEKEQQENRKRVFILVQAFDGEEVIGENSLYQTFTYQKDIELNLENISELADLGLSDITEYTISGRIVNEDDELIELRSFTNEELRTTIEDTG